MDYVLEIPNNLSDEKCDEMIKRFESDDRKEPGVVGLVARETPVKRSMDLTISSLSEWKDIDKYLYEQLSEGIKIYMKHLDDLGLSSHVGASVQECYDNGYQMQRTSIGNYYSWHSDSMTANGRFLTFLWYLSSHDPVEHGGGTGFHPSVGDGGKVIKPEKGKLIIFPATWTYLHMGFPLWSGDDKYVCTGWLHASST